jgi:tRNA threonylcarbamoyladenosine biosynthesis protein TsaE
MRSWTVMTHSPQQTRAWGGKLGKLAEGGEIVGLIGELGTGKTCFVRGVTDGLGVSKDAWIRSPSFTLINEYHGRLPVYHIDLYRIESRAELEELNLREYLYAEGVSLIEWSEKLPAAELDEYLEVQLAYANRTAREVTFTARGGRYERILERLKGKD